MAKKAHWQSIADVRVSYQHADAVGRCTVFNIGGNKYRLIVKIEYKLQTVYIKHVLTHAEYDKGDGNVTASHPTIDRRKYARLLAKTLPAVIETEEQNERMLHEVERLIDKGQDKLSPEEETLFKLMTRLIEDFEEQHYQLNAATPVTVLKELMAARDLQPKDLMGGLRLKESDIRSPQRQS